MSNEIQEALLSISKRKLVLDEGHLKMFENSEGNHTLQFITQKTPPSIPDMCWVQVGETWVGELTRDQTYLETVRKILTQG